MDLNYIVIQNFNRSKTKFKLKGILSSSVHFVTHKAECFPESYMANITLENIKYRTNWMSLMYTSLYCKRKKYRKETHILRMLPQILQGVTLHQNVAWEMLDTVAMTVILQVIHGKTMVRVHYQRMHGKASVFLLASV